MNFCSCLQSHVFSQPNSLLKLIFWCRPSVTFRGTFIFCISGQCPSPILEPPLQGPMVATVCFSPNKNSSGADPGFGSAVCPCSHPILCPLQHWLNTFSGPCASSWQSTAKCPVSCSLPSSAVMPAWEECPPRCTVNRVRKSAVRWHMYSGINSHSTNHRLQLLGLMGK